MTYLKKKYIILLATTFSICLSNNAPLPLYLISSQDSSKISSGEIVVNKIQSYDNGEHFCVYGVVNKSINEVFKVISNEEEYPNFMPRFTAVDYHYTDNNYSYYTFHIGLPLSITYKYKIKITEFQSDANAWIAWELVDWEENSIADTWGQWYFIPVDGNKNSTLIQYQTYINPGHVPFGMGWIIDLLTRTSLPHIIGNSKKYIEKR